MTGFVLAQTRHTAQLVDHGRRDLMMGAHHQERQSIIVTQVLGFVAKWRLGFQHGQFLVQGLRAFEVTPLLANDIQSEALERDVVQTGKNGGNGMFRLCRFEI